MSGGTTVGIIIVLIVVVGLVNIWRTQKWLYRKSTPEEIDAEKKTRQEMKEYFKANPPKKEKMNHGKK